MKHLLLSILFTFCTCSAFAIGDLDLNELTEEEKMAARDYFSCMYEEITLLSNSWERAEETCEIFLKGISEGTKEKIKEAVRIEGNRSEFTIENSAQPSMFGLPALPIQSMASILTDPDVRMHTVRLTAAALTASLIIQGYRFLGIGGRKKALAAVVPPGMLNDWLGRPGYRVPPHEEYTLDNVRALAMTLNSFSSEQEAQVFLELQDPELIAYFHVIVDYVRRARAIEYSNSCPNPDLCA